MTRAQVTAIATIVLLASGTTLSPAANADSDGVPFGCDAAAKSAKCFFKLFLGPRNTRIVQLKSGMKVNIPGIAVGQDKYCVSLNEPPAPTCQRIAVNATYNN